MAEVNHFYSEDQTLRTTTSATYVTRGPSIAGTSLAANTKYLIIARALLGGNSLTDKVYFRVSTADDTTIETKSETILEFNKTTIGKFKSWFFTHSFTTDASPADIVMQLKVDGGSTARMEQSVLVAIDLDDLGSSNYFENIQAASGTELSTTAWGTEMAAIADTDLGTTEEWLVLGYARIGVGSATRWYDVRLHGADDAASASIMGGSSADGEDTSELRMIGLVGRHKAVTSNVALAIDAYEEAANANHTDQGAYLIAIKGSAFDDFEHDFTAAEVTLPISGNDVTVASIASYTPTTNGNHLLFGSVQKDGGNGDFGLHLEDGTTPTFVGDELSELNQGWGGSGSDGDENGNTLQRINITATKTYNLIGQSLGNSNILAEDRWLLILNLNLAAGGTQFNQTVAATSTMTPDIVKKALKSIDASSTVTLAIVKKALKSIASTSSMTPGVTKGMFLPVDATSTLTPAMFKKLFLPVDAVTTATPSMVRKTGKLVAAVSSMTPAVVKRVGKTIVATTTATAALIKKMFVSLDVTSTMTPVLTKALKYFINIDAVTTVTPLIVKEVKKTISLASTISPGVVKKVLKSISSTSTITPALVKQVFVSLDVSSTMTPTLVTALKYFRTLAVTSTMTPVLTRAITFLQAVAAVSAFTVAVTKQASKSISASTTFTVGLVKKAILTLSVVTTPGVTLSTALRIARTLSVNSPHIAGLGTLFVPGGGGGGDPPYNPYNLAEDDEILITGGS